MAAPFIWSAAQMAHLRVLPAAKVVKALYAVPNMPARQSPSQKKMLASWDQGFNDRGEQVWGALKGGYEFIKK